MKKLTGVIFLISFLYCQTSFAQKGSYIQPYYLLQYTQITNQDDYLRYKDLVYETTYNNAFGVSYIYNFSNIFGIETGVKYAFQGQKYSGIIDSNFNDYTQKKINYESEMNFTYFMVPVIFKFNSILDEDRVYLSIGAGLQLDFLQTVDMSVTPAPVPMPGDDVDLKEFYNNFNVSFISNAYFNVNITDNLGGVFGFQMFRTMGNIENYDYAFDKTQHPVEYCFPIGVKKAELTDLIARKRSSPTKNISYSMLIGLNYLISKGK